MGTKEKMTPEAIHSVPICYVCGSEHVAKDAWACFNRESGLWELENVYDDEHCHTCEGPTKLDWVRADAVSNARVRILNDRFRQSGHGKGTIVLTTGIQALGHEAIVQIVEAVRSFDAFSEDNDPWGEHDFGAVEIVDQKIFWKLDCYDPTLTYQSENAANEALTHRVLTIMLASEY